MAINVVCQGIVYVRFIVIVRFIVVAFIVVSSAHAYGVWPLRTFKLKRAFALFIFVLFFSLILKSSLIPLVLSKFYVQSYLVGPSMDPTIPDGSCAVINKFIYTWKDPAIGDIVMFIPSDNAPSDYVRLKCKRIVAVGGETVQVRDSNVYVDGRKREVKSDVHRKARARSGPTIDFYVGVKSNPYLAFGVNEPYRVPEGNCFLLGDNRRYSVDSRCFGAVPRENITGKVIKISWPPRYMGLVK